MHLLQLIILFCNLKLLLCLCKLSVINICETLEDLNVNGNRDWQYVAITPEISCQNEEYKEPSEHLKKSSFDVTQNLEQLYIGEKLNLIDEHAFVSLKNIQLIKLWKNKLTVIGRNTFSGLPNLRILDLQDNGIENLQHHCFSNSTIKELDIRNNKLTNIQVDMVNLKSLNKILLSENHLSFLVDGCFGINVQHLDLSKNKITSISIGVLDKLTQLRYLNLSRNALPSIVEDFGRVTSLRNVKTLDLSYNKIETVDKDSFIQLLNVEYLYLNDNKIQYLRANSFPATTKLIVLSLHRNHLGALDFSLADSIKNLKEMTLGGNPWVCKYWQPLERHLASVRPKCDIDSTSGENPFCVANESLVSEAATFHKLYNCQYDT